ncbi:hypothetical protein DC094_21640 [Pelagibaculum spongiae]|uniref:Guanylate cyclase domain-containing protein n=2 Tax=Pelagibaculum spongiae TaxID=2080658 RepID=A0A2V1GNF3_9GAMM|nr:hypothetical protein DC094_21640 [Pelagibaculum spongiae]
MLSPLVYPQGILARLLDRLDLVFYDLRYVQQNLSLGNSQQLGSPVVLIKANPGQLAIENEIDAIVDASYQAGAKLVVVLPSIADDGLSPQDWLAQRFPNLPPGTLDLLAPYLSMVEVQEESGLKPIKGYGFFFDRKQQAQQQLPQPFSSVNQNFNQLPIASGIFGLQGQNQSAGFYNVIPDLDGVIRRAHLFVNYQGEVYPSLGLIAAANYLGATPQLIDESFGISLQFDQKRLNTGVASDLMIDFSIPYNRISWPRLGMIDENIKRIFRGKLVVIEPPGAPGQSLSVPFGGRLSAGDIQAMLIGDLLLNQHHNYQPVWEPIIGWMLLISVAGLLMLLLPRFGPLWQLLTVSGLLLWFWTVSGWLWSSLGILLNWSPLLVIVIGLMLINLGWGFLFERRQLVQLKDTFGQYVPEALVSSMEGPSSTEFQISQNREMTVLFADIQGFTKISEMLSPRELQQLLNRFFTPMTEVIFNHGGTVDKYVGDMIMAFWGAPTEDPMHAENAVKAALEMIEKAASLSESFARENLPVIRLGIGVNSGYMSVGDMGSRYRRAYTVLGDNVNLASRLESLTRNYSVELIVGENTQQLLPSEWLCRRLDCVRVRGRQKPEFIYQPISQNPIGEEVGRLVKFHDAQETYFQGRFNAASRMFAILESEQPLVGLYRRRLDWLERHPIDSEWDGVFQEVENWDG